MSHTRYIKPPKIPGTWDLAELLPDKRRPALADIAARHKYFQASLESDHTSLVVNNTTTQTTAELQRIKSVQVGTVSGGTVTVQVQIDGRDVFLDALRPVSGGRESVAHAVDAWHFPAGSVLSTIIEATSGVPAGTANIIIEVEPLELLPRFDEVHLRGKDRLRVSKQREAAFANAGGNLIERGRVGPARENLQATKIGQQQLQQVQTSGGTDSRFANGVPLFGPGGGGGGGGGGRFTRRRR